MLLVLLATSPVTGQSDIPGHKLWNYSTGSYVYSSPTVVSGTVYVGSYDYNVLRLRKSLT